MTEEIIKEEFDKAFKKNFPEAVIIDGVNVAGCRYYNAVVNEEPYCNIDEEHLYTCSSDNNCYYKQLQRLKQENKEFKNDIDKLDGMTKIKGKCGYEIIGGCSDLRHLKQENEELKAKIIELSEEKGHLIVENNTLKESNQSLSMLGMDLASANETIRKEFFRADKNKDMWRETAEKYRSALEEIKNKLLTIIDCGKLLGDADDVIADCFTVIKEVLGNEQSN